MLSPSESDRAYAAGLVDGEGAIMIGRRSGLPTVVGVTYALRLQVTQDDRRPLDWLKERWAGVVLARGTTHRTRDAHDWMVFGNTAAEFLMEILPFLIVKRSQTEVALSFQAGQKRRRGRPPGEEERQRSCYEKMRFLNSGHKKNFKHPDYNVVPLKAVKA